MRRYAGTKRVGMEKINQRKRGSLAVTTAGVQRKRSTATLARIESHILVVRDQRIIIDSDLAALYGVTTKALNQAIKRNTERFPPDFMFRLSTAEKVEVVTACDHLQKLKFSKAPPNAFTEHGTIQAANVLNSPRAIKMGIYIVRAFVHLKQFAATHAELAERLKELEEKTETLGLSHDALSRDTRAQLGKLFDTLREFMTPSHPPKRSIGFVTNAD